MSQAKTIIESAGLEYVGLQERRSGDPGHLFNAPSGSTLMLTEVTRESVAEKLRQHNEPSPWIAKFAAIIRGQREEADLPEESTHYDLFCANCDAQITEQGPIEVCATKAYEEGWSVLSVERSQAECSTCANFIEPESSYAAQYRSGSGGRF